jgi:hypothetical protein
MVASEHLLDDTDNNNFDKNSIQQKLTSHKTCSDRNDDLLVLYFKMIEQFIDAFGCKKKVPKPFSNF